MNDLQRSLVQSMKDVLGKFEEGSVELGVLVATLRGLYEAAEFHDSATRDRFERAWSKLDHEHELRTEGWAVPGSSTEASLTKAVDGLLSWIDLTT